VKLFPLGRPKWRHRDPAVRRQAVAADPGLDQATLLDIIRHDPDPAVRAAACARIDDYHALSALMDGLDDDADLAVVRERVEGLQLRALRSADSEDEAAEVLAAVTDEAVLAKVVTDEPRVPIRLLAIERLSDPEILARITASHCGKKAGLAAVEKITDPDILARVAKEASNRAVRARAWEMAVAARPELAADAEKSQARRLLDEAESLTDRPIEDAWAALAEIERQWAAAKGRDSEADRRFTAIRESLAAAWHDYRDRRNGVIFESRKRREIRQRLEDICRELRVLWDKPWLAGEGEALKREWRRLLREAGYVSETVRAQFDHCCAILARNQAAHSEERRHMESLVRRAGEAAALADNGDLTAAREALAELRGRLDTWRPRFVTATEAEDAWQLAAKTINGAEEAARQRKEAREEAARQARQDILARIDDCRKAPDIVKLRDEVDGLCAAWRQLPPLPKREGRIFDEKFARARALFRQAVGEAMRREDWKRWQNKVLKEELVADVAALADEDDMLKVYAAIRDAREKWRAIGPVPRQEAAALWKRFDSLCDEQFARCARFFDEQEQKAKANLAAKAELCRLAAGHEESTRWRESTDALRVLQRQWKELGRIGKEDDRELYAAFRRSCDRFFDRRKAFYQALDERRQGNAMAKERLIARAERLAAAQDEAGKAEILRLQREWKAAGPAPRDREEELWSRFRSACDRYFAWLDTLRPRNLELKNALCEQAERLVEEMDPDKLEETRRAIVDLQRRWREIGPVPDEHKDDVWRRFRQPCDRFFETWRREQEKIDRQRPENESRKEAILKRLDELIAQDDARSAAGVMALQEEWKEIGPASRERERDMQRRFKERCNAFFRGRRQAHEEMDRARRQNLREKEALCLRLEVLAGTASAVTAKPGGGSRQGLTLAEQLKIALDANAGRSGTSPAAGKRHAQEEIARVERLWREIGPVPREHRHLLEKRHAKALAVARKAAAGRPRPGGAEKQTPTPPESENP